MDLLVLLQSIIVALVTGITVAVINNHLSIRRFKESRLHEKRIEVIGHISGQLFNVERPFRILTEAVQTTGQTPLELLTAGHQSLGVAQAVYFGNKTIFEQHICILIESFIETAMNVSSTYWSWTSMPPGLDKGKRFDEAVILAHEKLPAIRSKIDDGFRHILGTEAKSPLSLEE